ncbi:hypothetical protein [Microbispora sp. H13382]|uniref:hypothetical protein n=1 Tax=Microbispora sp. H13382 TaxID=2729112 RepID=UPI0015FF356D|nr:hypothetical protein [Microbispora sp. H13382]
MTDLRPAPSSGGALPDGGARPSAVADAAEAPGVPRDPFPGDTHWYDLPDDDAAPEEDEDEAGARWRPWLRRR